MPFTAQLSFPLLKICLNCFCVDNDCPGEVPIFSISGSFKNIHVDQVNTKPSFLFLDLNIGIDLLSQGSTGILVKVLPSCIPLINIGSSSGVKK